MQIVFGIIIGLVILMLLVVAHEFGHFIMARRSGVRVLEFGIGFAPRVCAWVRNPDWKKGKKGVKKWLKLPKSEWGKPQKELIFSLNWLPIGGFCAMDGESNADKRKGTFGATSFWNKTKILFAGVTMNWLVAFILLTILSLFGMPQFIEHQFYLEQDAEIKEVYTDVAVVEVMTDSPAEKAGFLPNDLILKISDQAVLEPQQIINYGKQHAGEKVKYIVQRGEETIELEANLNPSDVSPSLGISMSGYGHTTIRSTWSAPIVGLGTTIQITGETFRGLWYLVKNFFSGIIQQFSFDSHIREDGQSALREVGGSVSGPVGIIGKIFPDSVSAGLPTLTLLASIISISLACMNVLPIPALDGGRWLLIAIYRLRRKTLTKETEERIVSRAFMFLLMLILVITVIDIMRLF